MAASYRTCTNLASYQESEFRHFGCSLMSYLMTWWVTSSPLVPMSRRPSAGDEARLHNEPNSPLHLHVGLPERVEEATRGNRCVVCSEKYKQSKRVNPAAKDKDLPRRAKTVYWCKSCKVFLCIASGNENCFELYHSKVQFWR